MTLDKLIVIIARDNNVKNIKGKTALLLGAFLALITQKTMAD